MGSELVEEVAAIEGSRVDRAAAADLARGVIALRLAAERVAVARGDVSQLAGNLRAAGVSWSVIGEASGITRQAAQQRFGSS